MAQNAERYVLGAEIARGGMGVVYRATDTNLDREVAVKVLQSRFDAGGRAARRFGIEARITARLPHPSVPPVHELGVLPDGRPFLAMKLIEGRTLADLLAARSSVRAGEPPAGSPEPPPVSAADRGPLVAAFEQTAQGVAFAHSRGVIHRDLKPANIMVGAFGEVQVMDWGLAKDLATRGPAFDYTSDDATTDLEGAGGPDATADVSAGTGLASPPIDGTQAGSVIGTPAFMPPEQAIGAVTQIDMRSDVFGLGAILAVILTGQPPFVGANTESTRQLSARGKLDECFARLDRSGADPDLVSLAKRCLAPEKEDRPADAGEVARAVAGLRVAADERARQAELDKVRAEGEKATADLKLAEQRKRRRALIAAVVLLALGAVGATIGFVQARAARADAEHARDEAKTALRAEQVARKEADESLQLAQESVVGVAWTIPDVLRLAVFAREAEKRVTLALAETMEKQLALSATRHLPDRALHATHVRLGELWEVQVKTDDALKHYRAALAISDRVLKTEAREKDRAKADHATSHQKLGTFLGLHPMGLDPETPLTHLRDAVSLFRELTTAPTTGEVPPAEAQFLLAGALHELAVVHSRRQDFDKGATACREAVALRDAVAKLPPTKATATARVRLADSHVLLADIEFRRSSNAAAEKATRAAVAIYEGEIDRTPFDLDLRRKAANTHRAAGDLLLFLGRYEDARYHHARDVHYSRTVLRMPEMILARMELSFAYYRSGTLALKRGDREEAKKFYKMCVEVREEAVAAQPLNLVTKMALARALARAGDHAAAIATFEPARAASPQDLNTVTQVAVVYSLCADAVRNGRPVAALPEGEQKQYRDYLDKAFTALTQSVSDDNWRDIVGLKTDPDFDPLREDPRFAAAVKIVEDRIAGKAPPAAKP